jgi:hypothetical protein
MLNLRQIFKYHPLIHNFAPKAFPLAATSESLRRCLRPLSHVLAKTPVPTIIPGPQAWLELDVDNVENATANLESRGYRMLSKTRKSPGAKRSVASSHRKELLVGVSRSTAEILQEKIGSRHSGQFVIERDLDGY